MPGSNTSPFVQPDAVKVLFDQLAGGIYHGMAFRNVLRQDPEARQAAETLVARLKAANVPGIQES